MNAQPEQQRRLLDVADLDAAIFKARTARDHPTQAARVRELVSSRQTLTAELVARQSVRDDLQVRIARVEQDVEVVAARRARDRKRLDEAATPKEAQGLDAELASLARRTAALEDDQLSLMEELEAAEAAVGEQQAKVDEVNAEGARLSAEGKAEVAAATARLAEAERDRLAVASEVPADLLALYEKLALRGTGAARLRGQTCEGCRLVLSGSDLSEVRDAPADQVVRCPECECILVRTEA